MFENVVLQDRVISTLRQDLGAGTLPQALLFVGPSWSGKLTAALELARGISCAQEKAPWNCTCPSCQAQRHLLSPYILMAGDRNFAQEIRGSGQTLRADGRDPVRFLFVRSVRKLTRRFDPVLWEGDAKLPKAAKIVERLDEALQAVAPGGSWTPGGILPNAKGKDVSLDQWLEALYEDCDELAKLLPQDGVNAAMIRHMTYWSHTADASQPKFVILEGVELLNESARNSLLKTLEEPPANVWFILLSKRRQGIMQTILSRVRTYQFADRGEGEQEVLERVFRQQRGAWKGLVEFFSAAEPGTKAQVDQLGAGLWQLLAAVLRLPGVAGQGPAPTLGGVLALAGGSRHLMEDVVRHLMAQARDYLRTLDEREAGGAPVASARLNALVTLVTEEGRNALTYNRSLAGFVEGVYSKARSAPCDVSSSAP